MEIIEQVKLKLTSKIRDRIQEVKEQGVTDGKIKDTLLVAFGLTDNDDIQYHIAHIIKELENNDK